MGDKTGIEWTDATWNPVRGCKQVSEGCRNRYAMRQAHRFSGTGRPYDGLTKPTSKGPVWTGRATMHPEMLDQPLRWRRPRRIFVNSMSDLFHEDVTDEFIDRVFSVMAAAHHHVFQILTKRPKRMRDYAIRVARSHAIRVARSQPHDHVNIAVFDLANAVKGGFATWPLPNVHIGVSVEDQETADERIPWLRGTPAAVRWLSMEPLLGPVDLDRPERGAWKCGQCRYSEYKAVIDVAAGVVGSDLRLQRVKCTNGCPKPMRQLSDLDHLDWVVVGGESGVGARPMHPDWVRSIRDQCVEAGVPFTFKQWGAFAPSGDPHHVDADLARGRRHHERVVNHEGGHGFHGAGAIWMERAYKQLNGRLLDGRTWDETPEVRS